MKLLYGRSNDGPHYMERALGAILVALKLVYGSGDEPAHPHDQYRAFVFRQSTATRGRPRTRGPAAAVDPWYALPAPAAGTLLNEMPPFDAWKHRMRNLVFGPLPRGQIPYFPSDFWRMGPHNLKDYVAYTQALWGLEPPTHLKPVVQQLQASYADREEKAEDDDKEEEEEGETAQRPSHRRSPSAGTGAEEPSTASQAAQPSPTPPVLPASEYVTYYTGIVRTTEDWQRAGLHPNYRTIVELVAAFYEQRPHNLHNVAVTLEGVMGLRAKKRR